MTRPYRSYDDLRLRVKSRGENVNEQAAQGAEQKDRFKLPPVHGDAKCVHSM
jgi:hypothetical protein